MSNISENSPWVTGIKEELIWDITFIFSERIQSLPRMIFFNRSDMFFCFRSWRRQLIHAPQILFKSKRMFLKIYDLMGLKCFKKNKIYIEVSIFSYIIFTAFVFSDIAYLLDSWHFDFFLVIAWLGTNPFSFVLPCWRFVEIKSQEEGENVKLIGSSQSCWLFTWNGLGLTSRWDGWGRGEIWIPPHHPVSGIAPVWWFPAFFGR